MGQENAPDHEHRFPVWKVFIVSMLLAVLVVSGAVLVELGQGEKQISLQNRTFADGTTLQLRGVLGGKAYTFNTRSKLDRFKDKLPRPLRRLFPDTEYYEIEIRNTKPTLTVFYFYDGSSDFTPVLSDDTGWKMINNSRGYTYPRHGGGSPSRKPVSYTTFEAVPPRAPLLTLSFLQISSYDKPTSPIAEFQIRNPLHDATYTPLSGKLPAHAQDGGVSVSLMRMVAGVEEGWTWRELRNNAVAASVPAMKPKPADLRPCTWLALQVEEAGKVSTNWQVESIKLTHGSGVEFTNQTSWSVDSADFVSYAFHPGAWTGDGAFETRVEMARKRNHPNDETWTFDVDVPTTDTLVADRRKMQFGSTSVELLTVGGPGAKSAHGGCGRDKHLLVEFAVTDRGAEKRRFKMVSATDNLGRLVRTTCNSSGFDGSKGYTSHTFGLEAYDKGNRRQTDKPVEPVPTSVTLTVAATRSHFLNFIAEPEQAR